MRLATIALLACLSLPFAAAYAQNADTEALDGRTFFLPLLMREAAASGLPPEVADAVAMVETGYRPDAVGSSGEIGLMQVMPATAAQLGFHGTLAQLADPETNIHLGVTYLARAWQEGGGDLCRALTKYRAGLGEEVMTPLSSQYCARAVAWLLGGHGLAGDAQAVGMGDPFTVPMAATGAHPPQVRDPHVIVMPQAVPAPARWAARRHVPAIVAPLPTGVTLTPLYARVQQAVPRPRLRPAAFVAAAPPPRRPTFARLKNVSNSTGKP